MSEPPAPPRSMLAQRILEALVEMVVYFAGRLHWPCLLPSLNFGGGGGLGCRARGGAGGRYFRKHRTS